LSLEGRGAGWGLGENAGRDWQPLQEVVAVDVLQALWKMK
jgi:hypothetical protein